MKSPVLELKIPIVVPSEIAQRSVLGPDTIEQEYVIGQTYGFTENGVAKN